MERIKGSKIKFSNYSQTNNKSNDASDKQSEINYFTKLPDDLINQVVSYLDFKGLNKLTIIDKKTISLENKQRAWAQLIAKDFNMPLFNFYYTDIANLFTRGGYSMQKLYQGLKSYKITRYVIPIYIKLALNNKVYPDILLLNPISFYNADDIYFLIDKCNISYDMSKSMAKKLNERGYIRIAANNMKNASRDAYKVSAEAEKIYKDLWLESKYDYGEIRYIRYLCHEKGFTLEEARKYVDEYIKDNLKPLIAEGENIPLKIKMLCEMYNIPPYYMNLKSFPDFVVNESKLSDTIVKCIENAEDKISMFKILVESSFNMLQQPAFMGWVFTEVGKDMNSAGLGFNDNKGIYYVFFALKRLYPNDDIVESYRAYENLSQHDKLIELKHFLASIGVAIGEPMPEELSNLKTWQIKAMQYLILKDETIEGDWEKALKHIKELNKLQASLRIRCNLTKSEVLKIYTVMEAVILLSFKHKGLTVEHIRKLADACNGLNELHFGMLYHLLMIEKKSISIAVEQLPKYSPKDIFDALNPKWHQLIKAFHASSDNKDEKNEV